jgi:hypothetical protein
MGKKSAPAPIIPPAYTAPPVPEAVDRKDLDKQTQEAREKAIAASTSTKDGSAAPQASLLSERKFWEEQESKKTLLR